MCTATGDREEAGRDLFVAAAHRATAPWAVTLSRLLATLVRHLLFRKAIRYADEWPCIVHQMRFPLHMDLASLLSFEVLSIVWFRRWQSFDGHQTCSSIPLRMPTTSRRAFEAVHCEELVCRSGIGHTIR